MASAGEVRADHDSPAWCGLRSLRPTCCQPCAGWHREARLHRLRQQATGLHKPIDSDWTAVVEACVLLCVYPVRVVCLCSIPSVGIIALLLSSRQCFQHLTYAWWPLVRKRLFRELKIRGFKPNSSTSQIALKTLLPSYELRRRDGHTPGGVARPRGRTRSECKPISCEERHVRPIPAPFLLAESRSFPTR